MEKVWGVVPIAFVAPRRASKLLQEFKVVAFWFHQSSYGVALDNARRSSDEVFVGCCVPSKPEAGAPSSLELGSVFAAELVVDTFGELNDG